MKILFAGCVEFEGLEKGIRYLEESGFTCYNENNGSKIVSLLRKEVFDIIFFLLSAGFDGPIDFQSSSIKDFGRLLREQKTNHACKIIYGYIPSSWPHSSNSLFADKFWDDVLIYPQAIEILNSIQRVMYCGEVREFHRLSYQVLHRIVYGETPSRQDICRILRGSGIQFNEAILIERDKLTFPLTLTRWQSNGETHFYYVTSLSAIAIITNKAQPFMRDRQWVRYD